MLDFDLKDQTNPGLMLMTTQFQAGNTNCVLSNPQYDFETNTWSVNYIDEQGNLPWFKLFQICVPNDGPCYYFSNMISTEHTYLEGTTFNHTLPNVITDQGGDVIPDGDYVA